VDARDQFVLVERLGHVVVGAEAEALDAGDGSPQNPAIIGAMAKTDQGSELEFDQQLTGSDWRGHPRWRAREV
jgi:hypothetical protein